MSNKIRKFVLVPAFQLCCVEWHIQRFTLWHSEAFIIESHAGQNNLESRWFSYQFICVFLSIKLKPYTCVFERLLVKEISAV